MTTDLTAIAAKVEEFKANPKNKALIEGKSSVQEIVSVMVQCGQLNMEEALDYQNSLFGDKHVLGANDVFQPKWNAVQTFKNTFDKTSPMYNLVEGMNEAQQKYGAMSEDEKVRANMEVQENVQKTLKKLEKDKSIPQEWLAALKEDFKDVNDVKSFFRAAYNRIDKNSEAMGLTKGNAALIALAAGVGGLPAIGVATLGALTGCTEYINMPTDVSVTVDMSGFTAAMNTLNAQLAALTSIVSNMQANGAVQTELLRQQLDTMDKLYQELLKTNKELLEQGKTQDEIKSKLDSYFKDSISQMKTIAALLGTESPIYQAIMKISEQLDAGKISFEEAYNAMMEILQNIDDNVENIRKEVTELVNEFKEYRQDFNNATDGIEKLLQDIKDGVNTSKETIVNEVKEFREEVKESKDGTKEALEKLLEAIKAADENNIAGNKEIVEQLKELGISADMSKEEIIAAIEKNTQQVENNGSTLQQILNYVAVLPELLEQHLITNNEMQKILTALDELEVTAVLDPEVQAIIEGIADKLDEVIDAVNTQGGNITNELKTVGADVSKIADDVNEIKKNSELAITYYESILDAINALLDEAKKTGDTVVNIEELATQIGVDVAWIREHGGGGSGGTVDLSKLEAGVEQIIVELQAQQTKIDLMYAVQCKDSQEIKNISDKLDGLTDAVKDLLTNDESLLEFLETAFASINIKLDTNNETLAEILDAIGKIEDKMQVLIIIVNMGTDESIKKYDGDSSKLETILEQLLEEIENIVDE